MEMTESWGQALRYSATSVGSVPKTRAVTVSVSGVMVGDCAYGTATVKNAGSVPIEICP